ncbi:hypothetical protein FRC10_009894 [Ceratobasidium sp. 414]|nr:hypothetical protein FRC10_009894 [Ceratobasidium sp. 414]
MSKRKIVAAGYEDSGDEVESEPADPVFVKKSRPAVSALPRLGVTQPGRAPFQLPASKAPFGRSASQGAHPRAISVSMRSTPSAPETPRIRSKPMSVDGDSSEPEVEGSGIRGGPSASEPKTKKPTLILRTEHLEAPVQSAQVRSVRSLERQVNDLATKLERYQEDLMFQHKYADGKLTQLLEVVALLTPPAVSPIHGPGSDPASPAVQSTLPVADGAAVSNRMPTPELLAIVAKVSSLNPSKSLGQLENAVKGHTREAWYHMLEISAAKEIGPYYEDDLGNPDVFPEPFIDPSTKYCKPFPHWGKSLRDQAIWIPTFVDHFIALISKDGGELSALLRSLSEEDVIALMFHGPWKTAQTAWRTANKTAADIQVMRARQAAYHRAERKALARSEQIKMIPALQGPNWAFLGHPGYMSEEEEVGGTTIVRRPSYRATWVNNIFEAMRAADAQKLKVRPGPTYLPRQISTVDLPIPSLVRGTGNSKSSMRIAAGAISLAWREQHRNDFVKYSHLVDMKVVAKPDILDFLLKNPRLGDTPGADSEAHLMPEKLGQPGELVVHDGSELDGSQPGCSEGGEYDGAYGRQALSDGVTTPDLVPGPDGQEVLPLGGSTASATESQGNVGDFAIDPQLLGASHPETSSESQGVLNTHKPPMSAALHSTGPTLQQAQQPNPQAVAPLVPPAYPPAHPGMPPPPPLALVPGAVAATGSAEMPLAMADPTTSQAPAPKKRGRPRGSKNKPKVPPTN